jgi:hypothetical protein
MEDLTGKATGDTLTAAEWNQIPSELQNIITAGISELLTSGNVDQLGEALAQLYGASGNFWTEDGIADVYSASAVGTPGVDTQKSPLSLTNGLRIVVRPGNANTGASTMNFATLGAKAILREDESALAAGDLDIGRDAVLRYDTAADGGSGAWLLSFGSLLQSAPDFSTPRGYIDGMIMSNAADTQFDITFGAGVARNTWPIGNRNTKTITNSANVTKKIDVTWADGDAAGGLAASLTLDTSTWYHCFALAKSANGAADFGYDTAIDGSTLLADPAVVSAGYNRARRVGAVLMNAVPGPLASIYQFHQVESEFVWDQKQKDIDTNGDNPGTGSQSHTIRVPLGINCLWKGSVDFGEGDSSTRRHANTVSGLVGSVPASTHSNYDHDKRGGDGVRTNMFFSLMTSTSQEIKTRWESSSQDTFNVISGHGYVDPRDKDL